MCAELTLRISHINREVNFTWKNWPLDFNGVADGIGQLYVKSMNTFLLFVDEGMAVQCLVKWQCVM